jgi:glycerate-2-kinase
MARRARALGLKPLILTDRQAGDTGTVAGQRATEILAGKYLPYDAVLVGGETTPTLPPHPGKGGRNQHFAALTPPLLDDYPGKWLLASLGTDGSDYLPEVAGGMVDQETLGLYRKLRPDYNDLLMNYDSHGLLGSLGNSLIITGNTHTNVGDVMLYLLGPRRA